MSKVKINLKTPDVLPSGPTTPAVQQAFSPKDIPLSIWKVYQELGGDQWLLEQAQARPDEFLKLLKTIIPKNIQLAGIQDIQVRIGQPIEPPSND